MLRKSSPATAGQILFEQDLYRYQRCSEQYYLSSGKYPDDNVTVAALKYSFERLAYYMLKNESKPNHGFIQKITREGFAFAEQHSFTKKLFDHELGMRYSQNILFLDSILKDLDDAGAAPLAAIFPLKVKVKKTLIELSYPAVFYIQEKKKLLFVDTASALSMHALNNDFLKEFKLNYYTDYFKKSTSLEVKKAEAWNYFVFESLSNKLGNKKIKLNEINQTSSKRFISLVSAIEIGYRMPLLSCPYSCKYKMKECTLKGVE